MLKWLFLKNLALVEEASVEFSPGFNVITGETGAGKSVIMGAVGLLLGDRADKSAIRIGESKCEISAEFHLNSASPALRAFLEQYGLLSPDDSESILVRRCITAAATRNFVNSSPVNLPVLRQLGEFLIDIHAANGNQSLLKSAEQLAILDRFAALGPFLHNTESAWDAWKKQTRICAEFAASLPSAEETARLRRDAQEIERAELQSGEDDDLTARHALASNSRSIVEIASSVSSALTENEDSAVERIAEIRRILRDLERMDEARAADFLGRLDRVSSDLSDLSSDLASYASGVELDEGAFNAMEERMRLIQTLKRRYGPSIDDVFEHLAHIQERIQAFDNAARTREELAAEEQRLHGVFLAAARALRTERLRAVDALLPKLEFECRKLGFPDAHFELKLEETEPRAGGMDSLDILFTANPGVPPRSLRDVASSGEIARVMLAVKTVLADADAVPTLVFDEIDANIGGETAAKVGAEMAHLAERKQVICISHLPRVAAYAEKHFAVLKQVSAESAVSSIRVLSESERAEELARMLGGGEAARKHAETLLGGKKLRG